MPAATSMTRDYEYFRSSSPAWPGLSTLQSGLTIFAIIVILRTTIRFVSSCFRRRRLPLPDSRRVSFLNALPFHTSLRQSPAIHPSTESYWDMDEKVNRSSADSGADDVQLHHASFERDDIASAAPESISLSPSWSDGSRHGLRLINRPPPAPPLTPPELSPAIYTVEPGPQSQDNQDSFIHQPNPDYASASTASSGSQPSTVGGTRPYPQKLTYTKTVPVGIPFSQKTSHNLGMDLAFPSNSYPPTSPLLPPHPPALPDMRSEEPLQTGAVGLHGEVLSVLDEDGTGWTRHTRVYGGGVCLACAAAGRKHGEGGYYGDTVSPEEKRW